MTDTPMLRYNNGKAPLSLVPSAFYRAVSAGPLDSTFDTLLIEDVAHVLGFGALKYAANNWRKAGNWLSVVDCALRHMLKITRGETHDIESGIHHAAHVGCNIAFLLEFIEQRSGHDDRYTVTTPIRREPEETDSCFRLAYEALLMWRDGANPDELQNAAWYLAGYYETLSDEDRAFQPGTSPFAPIPAVLN